MNGIALNWSAPPERETGHGTASLVEISICIACRVPDGCNENDPRCGLRSKSRAELRLTGRRTAEQVQEDNKRVLSTMRYWAEAHEISPYPSRGQLLASLHREGYPITDNQLEGAMRRLADAGRIKKLPGWRWALV